MTLTSIILAASLACTVTDGDTIRCGSERIRLMGYDTPELSQPQCQGELHAALAAKYRLRRLMSGGFTLRREGHDRYGRTLARLFVGGRDVADIMVEEGHARYYDGGRRRGWCR